MPLEHHNLINADDDDPETLLENDNSKDLNLLSEEDAVNNIVKADQPGGRDDDGQLATLSPPV